MVETIEERRDEYNNHVWNHVDDAFQKSFDIRRPLSDAETTFIESLIETLAEGRSDELLATTIREGLTSDENMITLLLQLVGLTRNKILTDLKSIAASIDNAPRVPSRPDRLHLKDDVWALAGPYIATWARKAFQPLVDYENPASAIESLNQATWPGYIRQERAKRQGHEAEGRIASLLFALGIPFEPEAKADNPLTGDATLAGISFDIIVAGVDAPFVVVKSTVQTANIGQFGESKVDLEIQQAQGVLAHAFDANKPILVAFVDGVGFYSNTQGLNGALEGSDEFAQFKTIWKLPVIAAVKLGLKLELALPDVHLHDAFLERYSTGVVISELTDGFRKNAAGEAVEAGEALIVRR